MLKRIVSIARKISRTIVSKGKIYEVDEMCTYITNKRNFIWLVYALDKNSKTVGSFNVGKCTNKTLNRILETLKLSEAKKIFTDRLKNYRLLLNPEIDHPEEFLTFDVLGNISGHGDDYERGNTSTVIYRLNRDELLICRQKVWNEFKNEINVGVAGI